MGRRVLVILMCDQPRRPCSARAQYAEGNTAAVLHLEAEGWALSDVTVLCPRHAKARP